MMCITRCFMFKHYSINTLMLLALRVSIRRKKNLYHLLNKIFSVLSMTFFH